MKILSQVLLSGVVALALLAGCSRPDSPPPPAAATGEDRTERAASEAPVAPPVKPQKSAAEQAATLLNFIDDRPECQQFRAPLEQASAAPAGATVELNMGEIMDQAYKAGCQRGPG